LLAEGTLAPTFKSERGTEATPLSESPSLTGRRHRRRPLRGWQVGSPVLVQLSKRILEKGGVSYEGSRSQSVAQVVGSGDGTAQVGALLSSNEDIDYQL
jgi:hypothetical protein